MDGNGEVTLYRCDRCKKLVEGGEGDTFTSGFYYVDKGCWAKYGNPYETVVCDRCMWGDPRYVADYGVMGQP